LFKNIVDDVESIETSSIISEKNEKPVLDTKQLQNLILVSGGHQIGKISERHPKCEDAYFITENAFGVSDGVSGWNDYGFSSDEFSKQLMQNAKILIEKKVKQIKKQEKKTTFE
jgi:serine/threonine protein phosphatase PrpC